jgi:hypothetical protein
MLNNFFQVYVPPKNKHKSNYRTYSTANRILCASRRSTCRENCCVYCHYRHKNTAKLSSETLQLASIITGVLEFIHRPEF